jgi:hypothetical protein
MAGYYIGKQHQHPVLSGLVWGGLFGLILARSHQAVRRWMLTELALMFAIIYTVEDAPNYLTELSGAEYEAALAKQDDFFGLGYQFPWYCTLLVIAFVFWFFVGGLRAWTKVLAAKRAHLEAPRGPLAPVYDGRAIIDVDEAPRPAQRRTARSERTPAPPMGSQSPGLYIPTYIGSRRPQRLELTTGGTIIRDDRRIDPDGL